MSRQSQRNQLDTAPHWKPGTWFSPILPPPPPPASTEVTDVEKLRRAEQDQIIRGASQKNREWSP